MEETAPTVPPPPSEQLLALEAAASAPVPRGTPDVVGEVPQDVPAAPRELSATERLKAADARVFGEDDTTPFDADLETLAAAEAPNARPLDLLSGEEGAVGTPAQRAAARQRIRSPAPNPASRTARMYSL